jgi:peptidoglycan/LPS O-acetylase OafA/YrhL
MSTFAKQALYSEGPSLTAAHRAPLDIVSGNTQGTHPDNNAFFPALDGLRALAFLMVFGFHYLQLPWGWTGVDIFFVISGFLITGILFDSCRHPHRIRNFYVRRTLRIFPLYYGVILLLVVLDPIFRWNWSWGFLAWPAYLGNWFRFLYPFLPLTYLQSVSVAHMESATFPRVALFLGHFWSLCIEEQFYLFWPWIVFWIKDRRRLICVCLACIVICPVLRSTAPHFLPRFMVDEGANWWFTPFRIDALLLGGLLALLRRGPHARTMLLVARGAFFLLSAAIVLWLILDPAARLHPQDYVYPSWDGTWGMTFIDLFAACLIVMALEVRSFTYRIFNLRPLRWLGRISYGAYVFHDLFHPMLTRTARHFLPQHWQLATAALALPLTILMAWASFRWYESRFILLKARWSR